MSQPNQPPPTSAPPVAVHPRSAASPTNIPTLDEQIQLAIAKLSALNKLEIDSQLTAAFFNFTSKIRSDVSDASV
jgi:hypothetical protein